MSRAALAVSAAPATARWERRSRTSEPSPGSATCGWRRRFGSCVSPWARVRDVDDATLAARSRAARRLMQASLATGRPAGTSTAEPVVLACAAARSSARAARGTRTARRTGVRVSGRRRAAGRVTDGVPAVRSPHCTRPARLLPRRLRLPGPRARGGRRAAVRVRGARAARRPGALRVPAAGSFVRRVAGGRARGPRGRAARARRARARAGGGDLRARPRGAAADGGAGALSHGAGVAADLDGRGLRRLRLGRRRLRARLRGARAVALRRLARLRRRDAARRALGGDAGRARRGAAGPRGCDGRARAALAGGAGAAAGGVRPRGRSLLRARARARARGRGGAAGRAGGARGRGHCPSARDGCTGAAGPVLFERLDWRPFGIRPVLPIAATQPPGEPDRLDGSAPSSRGSCSGGSRSQTATRGSRRRSTAGSSRCSRTSRSAPSSCAARSWRFSARPGRCGPRCCWARSRTPARAPRALRALADGEQASALAADAVRRALVAVLRHGERTELIGSLDEALLGCGQRSSPARRSRSHVACELAHIWHRFVAKPSHVPASVDGMDDNPALLARLDRIGALDRRGAHPSELWPSCAACSRPPRRGAGDPPRGRRGGGRASSHGACTRHNRHVIAHWDEAPRRAEVGHLGAVWSNLGVAAGTKTVGVNRIQIDPGKWSTPYHRQTGEEEIFYVLSGSGVCLQDEGAFAVRAGDCVVHRLRQAHSLRAGDDGLDVLVFGTRGRTEIGHLPRRASPGSAAPGRTSAAAIIPGSARSRRASRRWRSSSSGRPTSSIATTSRAATAASGRRLAVAAGSELTGLNWGQLDLGDEGAPPHCHSAEEEIFVVLEGEGILELWPSPQRSSRGPGVRGAPGPGGPRHLAARRDGYRARSPRRRHGHDLPGVRDAEPERHVLLPRSNKIYFRGLGLIARLEELDYDDGEPQ